VELYNHSPILLNGVMHSFNHRDNFSLTFYICYIIVSIKIDADALKRRRRPFLLRYTIYHICQRQGRQYATKCACIYDIWNVKIKIHTTRNMNSPNSFKLRNCLYYRKYNGIARFNSEHVSQRCGEAKSISI